MSVSILPIVILPLTFLFVLLIILIAKSPKAGAWVVGGLLLLTPAILLGLARGGALAHEEALPLFILPATFLFVLLVILLAKAPKVGAGLIVVLVVMVVLGFFLAPAVSHHQASYAPTGDVIHSQWEEVATEHGVDRVQVWDNRSVGSDVIRMHQDSPIPPLPPAASSPIWSEGVEQEFQADVYPSSLAAARALGLWIDDAIRKTIEDPNASVEVIVFQEGAGRDVVAEFTRSLERKMPELKCSVEVDPRNIRPGEVGITFRLDATTYAVNQVLNAAGDAEFTSGPVESGALVATAFTEDRRASMETHFVEKSWVESFGAFASARPEQAFLVARSNGTCTSEGEAHQQALDDARTRLNETLGRHAGRRFARLPQQPVVSVMDVQNGGFVADRFVQSLETSAGKVWRQALLVDVSGSKLTRLAATKVAESRQIRESWAWMGLSVVGVLVLIGVIYFFLNMATRGYYEWSLRIAGVVLAVVAIVSILRIVH